MRLIAGGACERLAEGMAASLDLELAAHRGPRPKEPS